MNRKKGDFGAGISIFVPAGKDISPLCLRKKKQNWPKNTNS